MVEKSLNYKLYKNMLLLLKCNSKNGVTSIAKPMFLLSIIDVIDKEIAIENKFYATELLPIYTSRCKSYGKGTTPFFYYPYCYMTSDGFYHLKWKDDPIKIVSPSAKFIREHIEYAYLDNALWDLLQEPEIRREYRELIINHYFKKR